MQISKNLFFLTAVVTTLFVITVLAMVAMLVGDPDAPANVWFNSHGGTVLTVEVLLIGGLGMAAIIADRRETINEARQQPQKTASANLEGRHEKPPQS